MIRVKKIPMESTWAEFWKVVFMPDPAPRSAAGRLFITPVRFDEPKDDITRPMKKSRRPKAREEKSTGTCSKRKKATALPSMPKVAKGREPKRSESMPER